jgi:hypothetical protein
VQRDADTLFGRLDCDAAHDLAAEVGRKLRGLPCALLVDVLSLSCRDGAKCVVRASVRVLRNMGGGNGLAGRMSSRDCGRIGGVFRGGMGVK